MKNKKRIVCFGDSNTWGFNSDGRVRFDDDVRWTQKLQNLLGDRFIVRDEGACGRTSVFDDPLTEGLNGISQITSTLIANKPIELLIIMLGTNDCKERFCATSDNIADGIIALAKKAKNLDVWKNAPRILIINPVVIDKGYENSRVASAMGKGCAEKSALLGTFLKQKALENSFLYWDCNSVNVCTSELDFIHLNKEGHDNFASGLYNALQNAIDFASN